MSSDPSAASKYQSSSNSRSKWMSQSQKVEHHGVARRTCVQAFPKLLDFFLRKVVGRITSALMPTRPSSTAAIR